MKKILRAISAIFLLISSVSAQVVYTDPVFPTAEDEVTVYFDATQGNGALAGYTGDVYAHTGVVTNYSATPTSWVNVVGVWGTADPEVLMTNVGPDLYSITYTIGDFYGVDPLDTIFKMAFVFRNTDGSIVGREADGSDIFTPVYLPGINVAITSPTADPDIIEPGENVHITATSVYTDSMYLYINDVEVLAEENTDITYDYSTFTGGLYKIKTKAVSGDESAYDSTYFFVREPVTVEALPAGMQQGINYIDDNTVTLVLYAPYKSYVFAIGDQSDWLLNSVNYMKVDPDMATFWVTLTGLTPGEEYAYQYLIDGALKVADPLTEKVLDPWNDQYINADTYPDLKPYPVGKTTGVVSVFQTAQTPYTWAVPDYTPPANTDLVIYELLVRDFLTAHNYQTLTDTIPYLKTLGINAIELMPVMEFEGNESWGYNPSFFTALDKYYGTPQAFKTFVDSCHANGIAVILDIAMNHAFGQCPLVQMWWDPVLNVPAANSPYFNQYPTHDYNVGYDFNHESPATIALRNRIFSYWIQEYHVDGYRFDLSKGYTQNNTLGDVGAWGQYDAGRVAIWENIGDTLWSLKPDAKLILEHFAVNEEETALANYGFMLWGNMNYNYAQGTMGYSGSDLNWGSYQSRGWDDPNLVTYMESHDEERLMYKNITYGNTGNPDYNVKYLPIALSRMELAGDFFFTIPGPKMIWQFGELGYDYSIDFGCRVCNKPIRWDYFEVPNRLRIYQTWSALIDLKKTYDVFRTTDYSMSVSGMAKRINLNNADMNVTALGNFNIYLGEVTPNFQHTGWWYEFFTGDSIHVVNTTSAISLNPGEYRLYTDVRLQTPEIIVTNDNITVNTENNVLALPNPSGDNFFIQTDLQNSADVYVEVYSMSGQKIYSKAFGAQAAGVFRFTWDGTDAEAGVYMCSIMVDGVRRVVQLVKE